MLSQYHVAASEEVDDQPPDPKFFDYERNQAKKSDDESTKSKSNPFDVLFEKPFSYNNAAPSSTTGPVGPGGPIGMAGDLGPMSGQMGPNGPNISLGPMVSGAPVGPGGPMGMGSMGPKGPLGHMGPGGPMGPMGPGGPMGPMGSGGPMGFGGPRGPGGPGGPMGPMGPGGPMSPMGPGGPMGDGTNPRNQMADPRRAAMMNMNGPVNPAKMQPEAPGGFFLAICNMDWNTDYNGVAQVR